MLFSMIAILAVTVFNSEPFQRILGKDGNFSKVYKKEIEFSYTNAHKGRKSFSQPNYGSPQAHSSYFSGSNTRFFGAKNAYPKQ